MSSEPWRINFPVLVEPWTRTECLILWMKPIEDTRPGVSPTMCHVVGMNRQGQHYKFAASIADYNRAKLAPIHFLQANDIRAPGGVLVDPTGKVLQ